jgi:protein-S-isoprenylcysteine O-methyltransferase Ste14
MGFSGYVNKKQILIWFIGVIVASALLAFFVTKDSFSFKEFISFFKIYFIVGIAMVAFGIACSYWTWRRWEESWWEDKKDKKDNRD